jgi:hypothetical protein
MKEVNMTGITVASMQNLIASMNKGRIMPEDGGIRHIDLVTEEDEDEERS